jgi:hypothetical protein
MDELILKQSKQATNLTAGPLSRLYVGSIYSGIEMLAGLALIAISAALYGGKNWAWPMTLFLLSIPAMVNGYIGLGWLENLKKFPPCFACDLNEPRFGAFGSGRGSSSPHRPGDVPGFHLCRSGNLEACSA